MPDNATILHYFCLNYKSYQDFHIEIVLMLTVLKLSALISDGLPDAVQAISVKGFIWFASPKYTGFCQSIFFAAVFNNQHEHCIVLSYLDMYLPFFLFQLFTGFYCIIQKVGKEAAQFLI